MSWICVREGEEDYFLLTRAVDQQACRLRSAARPQADTRTTRSVMGTSLCRPIPIVQSLYLKGQIECAQSQYQVKWTLEL